MDQSGLDSMETVKVPPEIRKRKAYIQQFLASLSSQEVRDVTAQLAKHKFETDIIARIPHEIRLKIAEYLDAGDAVNVVNVSQQWRNIWREKRAMKILAEKCLPGFLPYLVLKNKLGGNQEQDISQLFHEAMLRQNTTQSGKFRSVLSVDLSDVNRVAFPLDPTFHSDLQEVAAYVEVAAGIAADCDRGNHPWNIAGWHDVYTGIHRYHDGKHAWSCELGSSHIIVDDFRSQLRRMYSVPGSAISGVKIRLLALGDKLLVAQSGRRVYDSLLS